MSTPPEDQGSGGGALIGRLARYLFATPPPSSDATAERDQQAQIEVLPETATTGSTVDTGGSTYALLDDYIALTSGGLPEPPAQSVVHETEDRDPRAAMSVRDFILARDCSVRLHNLVVNHELFEQWNVASALLDPAFLEALAGVHGLGRKSTTELLELLDGTTAPAIPSRVSPVVGATSGPPIHEEAGAAIDDRMKAVSIEAALQFHGTSARLGRAIIGARLGDVSLADHLVDPGMLRRRLEDCRGIGRTTVNEAYLRIDEFLLAAERGDPGVLAILDPDASSAAEEASVDGPSGTHSAQSDGDPDQSRTLRDVRPAGEKLRDLVSRLSEREQFVLSRRYGLDGHPAMTLQEIAEDRHVTRERIRQIEAKALRRLRLPANQTLLAEILRRDRSAIWSRLAEDHELLTSLMMKARRSLLDPWHVLVIDLVHEGLDGWLESVARPIDAGWLKQGVDESAFRASLEKLGETAQARRLPAPIASLDDPGLDATSIEAAVAGTDALSVFEGYLCEGRAGLQARRTIRLHALAGSHLDGQLFDIATLAAMYRDRHPDDDVAPRMFQMQMEEAPHLFCRLYDSLWFVLPQRHIAHIDSSMPWEIARPLRPAFERGTIGHRLAEFLDFGPRSHLELRSAIVDDTQGRVAESSVGAILLTNPCFRRVAPGIFDVCVPGGSYEDGGRVNTAFLNSRHARFYCHARYGGAPIDWYPAWGAQLELWLVRWARLQADDELLRSLLYVVEPSVWPAPPDEIAYWTHLKETEAAWLIGSERRTDPGQRTLDASQLLPTIAQLAYFGWTSWIAVNRTTDVRGDFHASADVLAFLAKAGLVRAPDDWQKRHVATDLVDSVFTRACREMHEQGALDWNAGVLSDFWNEAERNAALDTEGWIDNDGFTDVLESMRSSDGRGSRAFSRGDREPVDPSPIFGTKVWNELFDDN